MPTLSAISTSTAAPRFAPISTAVVWLLACAALVACARPDDARSRARDVERRILAPCCLRQTLEDHESDLARGLRAEIEHRVDAGEPVAAIEGDLVRRYGEQVRAMPSSWDPRALLGVTVAIIIAAGGVALWWFMRRRRGPASVAGAGSPASHPASPAGDDENADYGARLDDDLLAVD